MMVLFIQMLLRLSLPPKKKRAATYLTLAAQIHACLVGGPHEELILNAVALSAVLQVDEPLACKP